MNLALHYLDKANNYANEAFTTDMFNKYSKEILLTILLENAFSSLDDDKKILFKNEKALVLNNNNMPDKTTSSVFCINPFLTEMKINKDSLLKETLSKKDRRSYYNNLLLNVPYSNLIIEKLINRDESILIKHFEPFDFLIQDMKILNDYQKTMTQIFKVKQNSTYGENEVSVLASNNLQFYLILACENMLNNKSNSSFLKKISKMELSIGMENGFIKLFKVSGETYFKNMNSNVEIELKDIPYNKDFMEIYENCYKISTSIGKLSRVSSLLMINEESVKNKKISDLDKKIFLRDGLTFGGNQDNIKEDMIKEFEIMIEKNTLNESMLNNDKSKNTVKNKKRI